MVPDHWSNDAMVSMDRCGLIGIVTDEKRPRRRCQSCRNWNLNKLAGLQSKEDKREEALLLVAKVHRQLQAEP